jgi:hypothetical protein
MSDVVGMQKDILSVARPGAPPYIVQQSSTTTLVERSSKSARRGWVYSGRRACHSRDVRCATSIVSKLFIS